MTAHEITNASGSEQFMSEPQWRGFVCRSLEAGEKRMTRMEESIHANTEATKETAKLVEEHRAQTKEMLEVFKAMQGGFRVLGWMGSALKWTTVTAGSAITFWKLVTGRWPFM